MSSTRQTELTLQLEALKKSNLKLEETNKTLAEKIKSLELILEEKNIRWKSNKKVMNKVSQKW